LLPSLGYKCKICFDQVIGIACLLPSLENKCETCFDSMTGIAYLLPLLSCKFEICFDSVIGIAYLLPFLGCKCETCFDSVIGISLVLLGSCVFLTCGMAPQQQRSNTLTLNTLKHTYLVSLFYHLLILVII
jgi:hypothetical protein